jgi:hypothetical protein
LRRRRVGDAYYDLSKTGRQMAEALGILANEES